MVADSLDVLVCVISLHVSACAQVQILLELVSFHCKNLLFVKSICSHVCESLQTPESVSGILKPVVALYAMKVIETNLAWYMSEGLLSTEVGTAIPQHIRYGNLSDKKL